MAVFSNRSRVPLLLMLSLAPAFAWDVSAEEALVAVATNFLETAELLEKEFETDTGHALTLTTGSTGKLYAQIVHGAPYDLFLAADRERPRRLEEEKRTVAGSRFTYARGRLTLWSTDPSRLANGGVDVLRAGEFRHLVIAHPELAPYGAAARETLRALRSFDPLRDRMVTTENVGQAFAMVATGNAELGFVARSALARSDYRDRGSRWDVPEELHTPIRQDAVLLLHGEENAAARAFSSYLRSEAARRLIRESGYGVE